MNSNNHPDITIQALQRMPYYLQYLYKARESGAEIISSATIATALELNKVQVRKDISAICSTKGRPRTGFNIQDIIDNIEDYLGYNNTMEAVLVGVGSLGTALLSNNTFARYGLHIVAAFDKDPKLIGQVIAEKKILPMNKLSEICSKKHIKIGIITVPADSAQSICDELVGAGVKAIWNFAITRLHVPAGVLIQNENLPASLAVLSLHLRAELNDKNQEV